MATLTTPPSTDSSIFLPVPGPLDLFSVRLRRARLGLVVAIIGIVMIFISLTSAYVVRKGLPTFDDRANALVYDWLAVPLPALLLVNSFVLLFSSLTMELARRQAARDYALERDTTVSHLSAKHGSRVSWLALTIVLGFSFLTGQFMVWRQLAANGFYVATTPSSSFLYLLTGTHGVHLLGGLIALLAAGGASLLRKSAAAQYVLVDVTGWYWHFMAFLWLYILCLFEFVR